MRAWDAPLLPPLPGQGPLPTIFDTARQTLVQTVASQQASLYVCGITPYDATHMGHASTYLCFDLLIRAWLDAGLRVDYVQNVTDIDDPLLERAQRDGRNWQQLALEQTDLFRADMQALAVIPPTHYLGAVEPIPLVIAAVEDLLDQGLAYTVPGYQDQQGTVHPAGDIYFDTSQASLLNPDDKNHWVLGKICHLDREQMLELFGQRGGDPARPGKRDPLDPLLWRVAREGEPAWDGATLGKGRPGWHIECTSIAQKFLPQPFTVQGGGSDLRFPHHDMGAGHAYALTKKPMAEYYMHTGMVGLDGKKMSKSLGNLVLVSQLRAQGIKPAVIRLAVMDHHYRQDWFWTQDLVKKAQNRYLKYRQALSLDSSEDQQSARELLDRVRNLLAQDLNTPQALVAIDRWAEQTINRGGQEKSQQGPHLVRDLLGARLGLEF